MGSALSSVSGIGGGVGGAIGSIVGAGQAAGDQGESRNQAVIANNILQSLQNAPDISKPLILQQYKQAGLLSPEMEQNITAQVPAAIGQDSQAVSAQRQALQQMQQRAAGGLSAGDRAALTQSGLAAQGDVTSRLASIQQKQQEQGLSDSGSKLAMQLQAAQGGANTEAAGANQIAQQAQQAAIQATGQAAGLGSQLEGQNFNEGMANQNAANQMQRFNIQNQLGVQRQNTQAANQAQAGNLANAQQLSNANVSGANQEQAAQLQRQMQQYNANVNTANIKAGGANNMSNYLGNQAQQTRAAAQAIGTGLGGGAGAAAGAAMGGSGGSGGRSSGAGDMAGGDAAASGAEDAMFAWKGGQAPEHNFKSGGHVPGQANVSGDHPANDTVKAMLSPGEIVIPRTLAKSNLGKKLLKLLADHHEVQNELDKHGQG